MINLALILTITITVQTLVILYLFPTTYRRKFIATMLLLIGLGLAFKQLEIKLKSPLGASQVSLESSTRVLESQND